MSPPATAYQCDQCQWTSPKWVGRCARCQEWGSVLELPATDRSTTVPRGPAPMAAQASTAVSTAGFVAMPCGIGEFDRVLGTGLVAGSVVLVAGEPGVGKSTLLLQVLAGLARRGFRGLYASGEESVAQVAARAARVGAQDPQLFLVEAREVGGIASQVAAVDPRVLVVDSVQTLSDPASDSPAGGVTAVRAATAALIALAKERNLGCIVVGHLTKDGAIAGPRTLEHLVDVVVSFEGDRTSSLRLVRAIKNRFGPTEEVGCFEMEESGVQERADPSSLFRSGTSAPGSCLTVTLEGRRPIVAEVQALAVTSATQARRTVVGMDSGRMAVVQAVLERRLGLRLAGAETYYSSVGGLGLREPAADLAAALAMYGAMADRPMPPDWLAIGEVGLSGDLRMVPGLALRLAEAERLGFSHVVAPVPPPGARVPRSSSVVLRTAATLAEAVASVTWQPRRVTPAGQGDR